MTDSAPTQRGRAPASEGMADADTVQALDCIDELDRTGRRLSRALELARLRDPEPRWAAT